MNPIDEIKLGGIVTIRDKLIEQQEAGKEIFRLESGDPSFDTPPHIIDAINKALKKGHTHYTAGTGIKPLRESIARKLIETNEINVSGPRKILVTNGAMHALYIVFRSLCEPEDEIIIQNPTWTETADNISLSGGIPVRYSVEDFSSNGIGTIASKVTSKTKAIVLNSPHNPTGLVYNIREIENIIGLAKYRNLWIVSDEAYEHVLFGNNTHISPASFGYNKVISIFSFSKSYAMSGLRLGYLTTEDDNILTRMTKLLRCTINGVNSATQYGGVAALEGPQDNIKIMCNEYEKRANILYEALQKSTILEPLKPEGTFYCWTKINPEWPGYEGKKDGWAMTKYLADNAGIGSAPGAVFGPGWDNYIRFAYSCSTDQVIKAAKILENLK
jgi:aspartate aminotransferase